MKTKDEILDIFENLDVYTRELEKKHKSISFINLQKEMYYPKDFNEIERIVMLLNNQIKLLNYFDLYSDSKKINNIYSFMDFISLIDLKKIYVVESTGFLNNNCCPTKIITEELNKDDIDNFFNNINNDDKFDYYLFCLYFNEMSDKFIIRYAKSQTMFNV